MKLSLNYIYIQLLSYVNVGENWHFSIFHIDCDYFARSLFMIEKYPNGVICMELFYIRVYPRLKHGHY